MKISTVAAFAIAIALLTRSVAFAQTTDYNGDLARLKERESAIDRQIQALGFSSRPAGSDSDDRARGPRRPHSLFDVHSDFSQLRAPAGRMLLAKTETRLVVGPDGSPAVIELDDGQGMFSGLKVLGQAVQSASEGRLLINFDRLIFRTGKTLKIKGMALDDTGGYGLKAQVFSSKAIMIAGAMASSFISGYTASQQTQQTTAFGFTQTQPTGRNAALQGVSQTAADQSKRLIEDSTKEKPVLVVEPGTTVSLYFDEEVRF